MKARCVGAGIVKANPSQNDREFSVSFSTWKSTIASSSFHEEAWLCKTKYGVGPPSNKSLD